MIAQDLAIDLFPQIGGQPNNVSTRGHQRSKLRFFNKCFFMNNSSSTYARGIILRPSCSSRQARSTHIFVILERSILNFDLGSRKVKVTV